MHLYVLHGVKREIYFFFSAASPNSSRNLMQLLLWSFSLGLFFPDKFAAVCYFKSHRNSDFICWYMLKFGIDSVTRNMKSTENACNEKNGRNIFAISSGKSMFV